MVTTHFKIKNENWSYLFITRNTYIIIYILAIANKQDVATRSNGSTYVYGRSHTKDGVNGLEIIFEADL